MPNKVIYITFLALSISCTTPKKEYTYPISNPYPKLFTSVFSDGLELLKVDIKSSSIELDCSKRNDQPYYWCGIDGVFSQPVKGLPKKLETIFHVQLPKWAVENARHLLKQHKNKYEQLTVVIHQNPKIDKKRNAIWNQMFAFYDESFCVAFLDREDLCPKGSEIQNIYLKSLKNKKKYIF